MYRGKKVLAIIPARAGSMRIKNKNMRPFNGKPLVYWSLTSALGSAYIDHVSVNTDSEELIDFSQQVGIGSVYRRGSSIAGSRSSVTDALVAQLDDQNLWCDYDYLMMLQPTSPLRSISDIDAAIKGLIDTGDDALISVCRSHVPKEWIQTLNENMDMSSFFSVPALRSQDYGAAFYPNGAIFLVKLDVFRRKGAFYLNESVRGFEMSRLASVDIDDEEDFSLAEAIARGICSVEG